jgi:hypothetical protein
VAAPQPFQPAPHYAALFRPGAAWTYEVDAASTSTCTVREARAIPGGMTSQIDCTPAMPLAGRWVANAQGLFRVGDAVIEATALDPGRAELIIRAVPRASHTVVARGADWCVQHDAWPDGPAAHDDLCIGPDGIVDGETATDGERHAFRLAR